MSIATEITRLLTAKSALKTSIENKGVTVPSATKLDGYASLVNQISGGLSNTDAVLIVTVPTGSTVTAIKNGVSLSPTIWVNKADNTLDTAIFIVKASTFDSNPWTVTATLGTVSDSTTIIIDNANEYDVVLSYYYYLIQDGTLLATMSYTNASAGSKTGDYWYFSTWDTNYHNVYIRMDVTDYSELKAIIYPTAGSAKTLGRWSQTAPTASQAMASYTDMASATTNIESTFTFDLSSFSGEQTIGLRFGGNGNAFGIKELSLK